MIVMENVNANGKNKKWPQYLATITCVISMFSSGADNGWSSPSLPLLLSENHPLHLTEDEVFYVTFLPLIGNIIGIIMFPLLLNIIGRKTTILLTAGPQICEMIMLYFSGYSKILLYVGRILGGVSGGGIFCVVPVYIGEISEPYIRGTLLSIMNVSWTCGSLFVNIVGSYNSIETTSLITLSMPLLFLCTFSLMPESPYFLLMKNRTTEACSALKELRRNDCVQEELIELTNDVERQMSEKGRYKDLVLIGSNRRALLVTTILAIIFQFSGNYPLSSYAQVFFGDATDVIPKEWASMLLLTFSIISTLVSYFLIDHVGRRPLLLGSLVGCASCLTCLSVYFFLFFYDDPSSDLNWIPLTFMIFFFVSFNLGIGNIMNCLIGEIFSASVKTKSVSISYIIFMVFAAASDKIYQFSSDVYGLGFPLAFFALCQWLGLIFCWAFVPETKGKSLQKIQEDIKNDK